MRPTFADGLKACCLALAVTLAAVFAAETPAANPLIGLTRDQVVSRIGEPRSQIAAGNRLVMLFAKERLVLRDGVVIEVERLSAEPVRRPAETPPAPVAVTAAAPAVAGAATPTVVPTPGTVPAAVPPTATPGAVPVPVVAVPVAAPVAGVEAAPAAAVVMPPAPPEPKIEFKLVRPPSGKYVRPAPKSEVAPTPVAVAPTPPPAPVAEPVSRKDKAPPAAPADEPRARSRPSQPEVSAPAPAMPVPARVVAEERPTPHARRGDADG